MSRAFIRHKCKLFGPTFLSFFFVCSNSPAHKYYLATSPVSGALYLSDTSSRKVFKVKSLNMVKDVAKNLELVAGTGDQCLPYDETRCGDGGKAVEATLTNPRGKSLNHFTKEMSASIYI